ncbi:hypothetical protein [Kineococcus aurantiacus]|uniref:Uncharacterized protein n=1 Tax=Kineococcus aurantiacus TaxID=37633 RepID=A0A7Y9ASF1_9ACTN|nr:hypothetical protein [Kineococcus aurantiacus]NYD20947.1 hypothetical protein [Kineococcus aurantiacus]
MTREDLPGTKAQALMVAIEDRLGLSPKSRAQMRLVLVQQWPPAGSGADDMGEVLLSIVGGDDRVEEAR